MTADGNRLLIRGGRVYDHDGDVHQPALADILIEGAEITMLGPDLADTARDAVRGADVLDAAGRLVVPGLVNAHYHSHDTLCRGMFEELPLEMWLLYTMPLGANTATLTITNSAGLTVFQGDADTSSGKHVFAWDGKNNSGILQPDGAYNVLISGLDFSGNLLEITQTVFGRVTGAGVEGGLANLFLGDDITIAQDTVLAIKETKTASAGP